MVDARETEKKKKEIKTMKKYIFSLMALCASCTVAMAEVEVSGGVDFVSSYNWRGMQQSGPAFQPGAAVSVAGFELAAWGSNSFDQSATTSKELDFTLSYGIGGFSVAYTNYWWTGEEDLYFEKGSHLSEVALGYEFGESFPLAISISTMVAGDQDLDAAGDAQFSTYIGLSYPFAISSVDCAVSVGMTPWTGLYSGANGGFEVASVALNFSKALVETDNFCLPVFVDVSFSPAQKQAYLVAGMSFGF